MGFWTPPTDENRDIRKDEAENLSVRSLPALTQAVLSGDVSHFLDRINDLEGTQIEATTDDIPAEWRIDQARLEALASYLARSRPKLSEVLRNEFR